VLEGAISFVTVERDYIPRIAIPVPYGNEFIIRESMCVIPLPGKLKHIFDDFGSLSGRDCKIRPWRSWWCSREQNSSSEPDAKQEKRSGRKEATRFASRGEGEESSYPHVAVSYYVG
jgi:hypothetical protein